MSTPLTIHPELDDVLYFDTIDSTNLEAHRRRVEFSKKSVLFISDTQTSGKGQRGRHWESSSGLGLWMTLLLGRPKHLAHNLLLLSLYSGLAMQKAITDLTNIDIRLKWPNDLMIGQHKCGGILSEIQWVGTSPKSVIIGIGLNLKQKQMDFPESIQGLATSLQLAGWQTANPGQILDHFLNHFFNDLALLDQPSVLTDEWNTHAYRLNQLIDWHDGKQVLKGVFSGVNISGSAQIIIDNTVKSYQTGEIQMEKVSR